MAGSVVTLSFDDGPFTAFTSWSLRETFSDPLGMMEFTVEPPLAKVAEYRKNLRKGRLVGCQVDGKPQAAMMIQTTHWTVDARGGTKGSIQSVTPLKQLYEASVSSKVSKAFAADVPIIDLVNEVSEPFGIGSAVADNDIATIRSKTGKAPTATATNAAALKATEAKAQDNETAYQFLARVLTRLGVMLRMDAVLGTILITAPHYTGSPLYTVVQARPGQGPSGDHFFEVSETDTNEGQFSACTVNGAPIDQPGVKLAGRPFGLTATSEIGTPPPYRSDPGLNYKPKFVRDTSCRDAARAKSVSKLVLGLAAEKAYEIRGRVQGLTSADGTPWTIDTLGNVYVEALGIDSIMWLSERTMSYSTNDGQITELVWLPKGAFVLGDA